MVGSSAVIILLTSFKHGLSWAKTWLCENKIVCPFNLKIRLDKEENSFFSVVEIDIDFTHILPTDFSKAFYAAIVTL